MPQFKIYGEQQFLRTQRDLISETVQAVLVEVFQYPADKKFQRFMALDAADFIHPHAENYICIEVQLFEGRQAETKRRFLLELQYRLEKHDIHAEVILQESPASHWGIRGSTGDTIQLNYRVEV